MLRQQVVKPNFLYFMTIITTVAQYTLYTIQLLFVHKEDVAWNSLGFIIQSQPTGIKTTMTVSNRLRFNTSCWYCAPGNILHLKHIVRLDTHKHWIVLMERTIFIRHCLLSQYDNTVYLHSFTCYCPRNTRNIVKFQENLTLQQFKVIQGHWSWGQWKADMWLSISD